MAQRILQVLSIPVHASQFGLQSSIFPLPFLSRFLRIRPFLNHALNLKEREILAARGCCDLLKLAEAGYLFLQHRDPPL
jgi:hypothetical protein